MKTLSLSVYHWLASRSAAIGRFFDRIFAHREAALVVITCLCIVLFGYSGVIKLAEYDTFVVRIGQSPMLAPYAGFIGWFIPVFELAITAGLIASIFVTRIQAPALYLFFGTMVLFCFYIIGIFTISPDVPCACGGVIGEIGGWWGHLAFNLVFVGLSRKAIRLAGHLTPLPQKAASLLWRGSIALPFGIVLTLGLMVDPEPNHRHAGFERDFLSPELQPTASLDLPGKGFYFAGENDGEVYLSHHGKFDRLIRVKSHDLPDTTHHYLDVKPMRFHSIQTRVEPPYFYLGDGDNQFILRGNLADGSATGYIDSTWFAGYIPLSGGSIVLASILKRQNALALVRSPERPKQHYPHLLRPQQSDGLFSTDGQVIYGRDHERIVYLYNYRNEYLVMDTALRLVASGNTVDTISQAKLKVARIEKSGTYVLKESLLVNRKAVLSGDYLYVASNILSASETPAGFKKNTVIDIYDMVDRSYHGSFHVRQAGKGRVNNFVVVDNKYLMTIQGSQLLRYDIPAQGNRKKEAEHLFKKK